VKTSAGSLSDTLCMANSWNRMQTWVGLIVLAVGSVVAVVIGIFVYVGVTATPLHPDAGAVPSSAQSAPVQKWEDAVARARRIVRAGLTEQNLPGLSVAVGVEGEIVWAEGVGWADLEQKVPVKPDTLFRIGTASTMLTSAAAGLLIEQGRLKLDDEIQTYVPAFPRKEWPVTVRQLMGHLAGVRNDGGDEGPLLAKHCDRMADGLEPFAERSLLFQPGTSYRYSSYGWILVSAAVESASDEPFLRFMRTQIFDPLGMNHTRPDSATQAIADRATFYFPRFGADPRYGLHLMRDIDYSCYAGSSIFLSTPSDLVRFGMAIESGKLLQPATVKTLQTSQRLASGAETGYGLGWDLETITLAGRPTPVIGHDGDTLGGEVASLIMSQDHGIVVSVISNISYADASGLAAKIADAFIGQAKSPARP
jgi:serine beta-lactamase-like protein LACTB, mitochondrial